ncbi:acyl-ACP thioesterase domain-containing protein [Aeromicrobium sp. 50.2.37]|uniref:acyl-ACP thioesterase domain-containing protein n=1 Tax=Aeromicrobium sp. 50.2.37 TaxID=2969305 RepID=UPI0021506708|nr:acyl-ACP thioesterase domain-containing protein [Aeromicrobium sp. 50.2.37]MCR4513070.1 thioesterase [Aeromicrobium sp. 50.2.37]
MSNPPHDPTRLEHELPMRWADLDELSHVNNVVYLDYASEARAVHVAAGELADRPARSISVEFLRPLLLSRTPLRVTSTDDGSRLVQEIAPATSASPFARVTWSDALAPEGDVPGGGEGYDVAVRRSDLGTGDVATPIAVFEYAQEARIASVARVRGAGGAGRFVVAQVDLTLGEPFGWQREPHPARTVVTRVGRSSFTVTTLFDEGRRGRADAVLVGFDLQAQRSRVLDDDERAALSEQLSPR